MRPIRAASPRGIRGGYLLIAAGLGATAVAFVVLALVGWADSSPNGPADSSMVLHGSSVTAPCRSDPQVGVHDPTRLKILKECATFVGKVVSAPKLNPSDGDVTFNAAPDPGYESMPNEKNSHEGGIHIEIVPRDQPGCVPGEPIKGPVGNLGLCSGANVVFPPLGAHVRVIGPYVFDSWVGWNEIHPAWKVEILPLSGLVPPEAHPLKAHLTGKAIGAPGGSGRVVLTLTGGKLCWTFTGLVGIGRPTRAKIRAGRRPVAPTLLALGHRYRARGCVTVEEERLKPLEADPRRYYVIVATSRHRLGAIGGRVTPASD
jgi:hypothetical protein